MALNINTDKSFDEALAWLAKREGKSKSEVVRELVIERFNNKRSGFRFGALSGLWDGSPGAEQIVEELKRLDNDPETP